MSNQIWKLSEAQKRHYVEPMKPELEAKIEMIADFISILKKERDIRLIVEDRNQRAWKEESERQLLKMESEVREREEAKKKKIWFRNK